MGLFVYLFIWLCQVLVVAHGIFVAVPGLLSSCGVQDSECAGSVVVARRLSCPAARRILVSQPGIKPESPALEGSFLTTGPSGIVDLP